MTLSRVHLHAAPSPFPPRLGDEATLRRLRRSTTALVSELLDGPPAVALTSSCTHALEAASSILGIGAGDEVVVPAFAFPSTANAFLLQGARIRFADVDPLTGNVDVRSVERLVGPATRAVVCVHYGGVACDVDALLSLAAGGGFDLVEDAAHGLFASFRGTPLGRFGRVGSLSFHRTKNISAVDGGALVVNDPALAQRAEIALDKGTNRAEFDSGLVGSYEWSGPGSSWRLSDPLVAVLAEQLSRRASIQSRRHDVWDRYHRELADWAERVGAVLPQVPDDVAHPAHIFWILLPDSIPRGEFAAHCDRLGIQVARHYGSLPDSAFGRTIAEPGDDCPGARILSERLVRLPLHHELSDDDVDRIVEAVRCVRPDASPRVDEVLA